MDLITFSRWLSKFQVQIEFKPIIWIIHNVIDINSCEFAFLFNGIVHK